MNRIAKVLSQISDDMLMHYGVARGLVDIHGVLEITLISIVETF